MIIIVDLDGPKRPELGVGLVPIIERPSRSIAQQMGTAFAMRAV